MAFFPNSKIAPEYLQGFTYCAHTFYTALLELNAFADYRSNWLEALGDPAQYHIAIATMMPTTSFCSVSSEDINRGAPGMNLIHIFLSLDDENLLAFSLGDYCPFQATCCA